IISCINDVFNIDTCDEVHSKVFVITKIRLSELIVSSSYPCDTRERRNPPFLLDRMPSNFLSNTVKIQAIINKTLMECKDIDNAMHLFSSITNKSNYMYTVMFKGLITNNAAEKVLNLFDEMKIEPDQFNLSTLFNACAVLNNNRAMKTGKKLLDEMPENYRNNNITSTSAIDMLMKFGDVESAERIFQSIK
ncbi:unnamed protein product, partial [Rotaria magnacalcarata]